MLQLQFDDTIEEFMTFLNTNIGDIINLCWSWINKYFDMEPTTKRIQDVTLEYKIKTSYLNMKSRRHIGD